MKKVIRFITKNGKKIPITQYNYSFPKRDLKPHTIQLNRKRTSFFIRKTMRKKTPFDENWHSGSYKIGNYSLCATKKHGLLDYYIQIKDGQKEFLSIPLKPLITKTIDYGLSFSGIPIDSELLEITVQQILIDNKSIQHILMEQIQDELKKKLMESLLKHKV